MEFVNEYPAITDEEFLEVIYRPNKYILQRRTRIVSVVYLLSVTLFVYWQIRQWEYILGFIGLASLIDWLGSFLVLKIMMRNQKKSRLIMKWPVGMVNQLVLGQELQVYRNDELISTSQLEDITVFMETDNFVILFLKGNIIVPFKKGAFSTGTAEELVNRLKKLCIKRK